jgi:hypothetical protein
MRTHSTIFALAIAGVILASAAPAHAYDLAFEVDGFAGGHFFSDSNKLGRHAGTERDFKLQHSGMVGFRVGFGVIPRLTIEAELGIIPTVNQPPGDSVLAFGWRLHGLVHILTGRVRPFVLVGGGGFTASGSNPNHTVEGTRGEIHGGVGVKFDIRCNFGVRVDGRVQFGPATSGIYFTEDWEVTAALYGLFGKPVRDRCAALRPPIPLAPPPPPTPSPPPQPGP